MKIAIRSLGALLLSMAFLSAPAVADEGGKFTYEVKITNITKGQVFSPPVLITHSSSVALFVVGEPALDELATVAEDGAGAPLADLVRGLPQVDEAQANSAPIPPGASAIYEIQAGPLFDVISSVGMLVNTNDAFFAVDSAALPRARGGSRTVYALSFDAGSEANNEDCAYVPGPACAMGSGNARATDGAEGFVHVHNGVHGIADLAADAYDWRNPVARVTITRTK